MAAINASFRPLESLNLGNILGLHSQNLALSLFWDIIKAYFSTFTILLVILFLFITFLSFDSITDFYTELKSFPSKKISKDHLSFCAFSLPKRKEFLFPDDFNYSSGNIPDGPLEAVIKPGYALLMSCGSNYSVKFNYGENLNNFHLSLAFREKIIDCFELNPASISFTAEGQNFSKSFLIEVAYSYELLIDNENMTNFANMLAQCDSRKIRKIIESILISESKIALSHYFRDSSGSSPLLLGQSSEKSFDENDIKTAELNQKKHSIFNFYKRIQGQGIKRNRKRQVYLSPSLEATSIFIDHEKSPSTTLKDQLNELLEINLRRTLITLFGINSIKAKVLNIHEQGSK